MKEKISISKFIKVFAVTGFSIAVTILIISMIIQVLAVKSENYYLLNEISIGLIHSSRQCAGTTAFGSFLLMMIGK